MRGEVDFSKPKLYLMRWPFRLKRLPFFSIKSISPEKRRRALETFALREAIGFVLMLAMPSTLMTFWAAKAAEPRESPAYAQGETGNVWEGESVI